MPSRTARWPIALLWLVAASGFGVVILWMSGYEPWAWWKTRKSAVAAQANVPLVWTRGGVRVARPTPQGTDSSVSTAPLPLHLMATRLGRNSLEGYADIGVNVQSPQTYRAGAILANGARLAEVFADSVVLERSGERWHLYMDGKGAATPDASVLSPMGTVGGTVPVPAAIADSHEALTDVVRIAPVFAGDQVRALELYPSMQSAEAFQRLGFEPGDRIVAINGAAVKDIRLAIAELRQVTAGAAVVVTVERGGRRQSLSVDGSIL